MAEMIPDKIPRSADSEKIKIFEILKHGELAQDRNWVIFHSIEVPQSANPSKSRVTDFVVLIPNQLCVICVFVKPSEDQSLWNPIRNRFVDPLKGAKDITEDFGSLYKASHFRPNSPLALGYAVVSPDPEQLTITIPYPGSNIESGTFDILETTLEDYAGKLKPELWEGLDEFTEEDWNEWKESFDNAQEELLVKLPFDLDPSYITTTTLSRDDRKVLPPRQLLRLTEDQVSSYEKFLESDRCVIDGAAGTGKTVLAKELAKQRCEKGKIVGLLCSNRHLSRDFEKWAATVSNDSKGRIIVGTPATLPYKIFEENSLLSENHKQISENHKQRLDESPELERTLRFGYLANGWGGFIKDTVDGLRYIIDATDPEPENRGVFDYLIVDEAQNLCAEVFLKLMDILLKQGLAEGNWAMFGDFVYQNIVTYKRNVPDVLTVLENFCGKRNWESEELKTNCRNTEEISDAVYKLIPVESVPRSGVHGPYVQIKFFDSLDELNKMLGDLISIYHNKGRQSKECILLSSGADEVFKDIVKEYGGEYSGWKLMPFREGTEDSSSEGNILRYSDVYDYQGLESNLVILVIPRTGEEVKLAGGDIILTRTRHLMRVLYTGMSRSHTMLVILAEKKSYKKILKASWPDYGWDDDLPYIEP